MWRRGGRWPGRRTGGAKRTDKPLPIELGAALWWDPKDFGADLDAGAIVTATDRIAGLVAAAADPSERPAYVAALPNGLPAMDCDGTQMLMASGAGVLDSTDWTIYAVTHPRLGDFGFGQCIGRVAPDLQSVGAQNAGSFRMSVAGLSSANVDMGAAPAKPTWQRFTREVGVEYSAQQRGGALATNADISVGVELVAFGGRINGAQMNNCTVQDWIGFPRLLSGAEDSAMVAWLEARYGGFP